MAAPPAHPNAPRRAQLALAFAGIAATGVLGGTIGWGLVDTSCSETPSVAQRLLGEVDGFEVEVASCDARLLGGAVAGTVVTSVGAGVVAGLMLRAQSEWRAHPPPSGDFRRARSAGTPRRT